MRIAFWGGVRGYVYSLSLLRFCSGGVRVYFLITSTLTSFVLCFFHGCCARLFSIIIIIARFLVRGWRARFFLTAITCVCVFVGVACTVNF